jgi:chitodextrinase
MSYGRYRIAVGRCFGGAFTATLLLPIPSWAQVDRTGESVVTATTVTLSWNASTDSGGSGLAGYKVYRGPIPVGTTTGTTFTDQGLVPGTGYSYPVRAFDKDQNHSAASSAVRNTSMVPTCRVPPGLEAGHEPTR